MRPDTPVEVRVIAGRLSSVRVVPAKGAALPGSMAADGTRWRATGPLAYGARYTAMVTAVDGSGALSTTRTAFTTLRPRHLLTTSISPLHGSTVGVGMPVVVKLSVPVRNRAAVERGLRVRTSRPVEGSWSWISTEELHYRPRRYWPAHTDVRLDVRLVGVDAGNGTWGGKDRTVAFHIGASMISLVDVRRLRMTVRRDGRVVRTIPVTTGKAGFLTRSGIKVISEKYVEKTMDATTINIRPGDREYYRLRVPYAMRITWSGEFVHGAPWSVGSQGRARVSHGCIGMSVGNAAWLFARSHVGDVVHVVGSPRGLEPQNGWTDWNVDWATWRSGSALAAPATGG